MFTIHAEPAITWQGPFSETMAAGLKAIGIDCRVTRERDRIDEDLAILLGTTCWKNVERTENYLLVDRCSFNDTNRYVSLVFNGHGRRGNHKVPENYDDSRWRMHGVPLHPWREGWKRVLCGQVSTYSPLWDNLEDWYATVPDATHFRPHPRGENPTGLPVERTWTDVGQVVTLNSSVAIDALIQGVDAIVDDPGGMAYGWEDRLELMRWLAWTQWSHDEIREGKPIRHLFDGL